MIVYVESNFVMELTYLQESHLACETILTLAEAGSISMVLPAFCLTESRMAWVAKGKHRDHVNAMVTKEIRELARSQPYADIEEKSRALMAALVESNEEDRRRLDETLDRLGRCAHLEPLRPETVELARACETLFSLSPQDSTVLATILQHAGASGAEPKLFLNKNSKDFANPDIADELARYQCTFYSDFLKALHVIPGAATGLRTVLYEDLISYQKRRAR